MCVFVCVYVRASTGVLYLCVVVLIKGGLSYICAKSVVFGDDGRESSKIKPKTLASEIVIDGKP